MNAAPFLQILRVLKFINNMDWIKIGAKCRIPNAGKNGSTHFAWVDSFTRDIFTGEPLVIVRTCLGELRVKRDVLIPLKKYLKNKN